MSALADAVSQNIGTIAIEVAVVAGLITAYYFSPLVFRWIKAQIDNERFPELKVSATENLSGRYWYAGTAALSATAYTEGQFNDSQRVRLNDDLPQVALDRSDLPEIFEEDLIAAESEGISREDFVSMLEFNAAEEAHRASLDPWIEEQFIIDDMDKQHERAMRQAESRERVLEFTSYLSGPVYCPNCTSGRLDTSTGVCGVCGEVDHSVRIDALARDNPSEYFVSGGVIQDRRDYEDDDWDD